MSFLIRWSCWLCSVVRWRHSLCSVITSGQSRSQAAFPCRMVPLVGCYWAGLWAGFHNCSWAGVGGGGGGLSGYAPSPDSAAGWTQCSGETQGRASCGFRLFSAIRWSCRLCPVGGWGHKLGFLITVDL